MTYLAALGRAESPVFAPGILLRSMRLITLHASGFFESDQLMAKSHRSINGLNGHVCLVVMSAAMTSLTWSVRAAMRFMQSVQAAIKFMHLQHLRPTTTPFDTRYITGVLSQ